APRKPKPPWAPRASTLTWMTPAGTVKVCAAPDGVTKEKTQVTVVVPVQEGVAPAGDTALGVPTTPTTARPRATSPVAPRTAVRFVFIVSSSGRPEGVPRDRRT